MSTSQVRYAYPKFKVFIFGVDITQDVLSVNTTNHDGAAPNTCQITLANELDKYILTTEDVVALNKLKFTNDQLDIPWLRNETFTPADPTTERGGLLSIGSTAFQQALNTGFAGTKYSVLLKKNQVVQNVDRSSLVDIFGRQIQGTRFADYYGSVIKKYPLTDGSPIFHPMDPVRVFMRDPFDPGRWYYHFTGFVSDMVDNVDQNNTKTLTIVAEDPTKLFRYTRIFINPGIIDANVVIEKQDMRAQSFYSHFMKGFNLPEVFFTLIFGPDRVKAEKILEHQHSGSGNSNLTTSVRGIGHFAFDTSGVFTFGPPPDQPLNQSAQQQREAPATKLLDVKPEINLPSLKVWQSIVDHEVQPSDLYTMAAQETREANPGTLVEAANATYDALGIEGVVDEIGKHPEVYLVDGGRLLMLIPNSLGADNNKVIINDIIQAYPLNSEWSSAGSVMYEVIDRIQFIMYCSPRGDIVIEPPLYDFDPDDFGMDSIPSTDLVNTLSTVGTANTPDAAGSLVSVLGNAESQIPGTPRGPYGPNYVLTRGNTYRWEAAFIDEKVYNVATAPHSIFQNYESLPNTSIIGDLAVVKIPHLIPLYGVRQIPLTPRGYIASTDGALLFCHIALNKLNADAHTFKVDLTPNIQMGVNRPIYIQGRNCISTIKQVTQSLTWGEEGDMETSIDVYATRTWDGHVARENLNQPVYSPIGSFASRPLDYNILFGNQAVPNITDEEAGAGSLSSDALGKISAAASRVVNNLKGNEVK
jgi:hypothetical protein